MSSLHSRSPVRVVGQRIDPHYNVQGFYVADVVDRQREERGSKKLPRLSDLGKRVYRHLVSRMGKNGVCYPSLPRIAKDLGKSRSSIAEALRTLKALGLIDWESRSRGRQPVNHYYALWHPVFEEDSSHIMKAVDGYQSVTPDGYQSGMSDPNISNRRNSGKEYKGRTQQKQTANEGENHDEERLLAFNEILCRSCGRPSDRMEDLCMRCSPF